MKKVAITGGIACGKSSVCQILKNLGIAYVVSADEIVHQLLSTQTDLRKKITLLLGPDIVVNGQLNRRKIAEKVFSDPEKLQILESLLHPYALEEIQKQYLQVDGSTNFPLFVVEIPLLYEIEAEGFYDSVIVVTSDKEKCLQRLKDKTSYGKEEYEKRMARQLPIEEKTKKADYIIENNGDLKSLEKSIRELIPSLVSH